jgi:hypothetical protein
VPCFERRKVRGQPCVEVRIEERLHHHVPERQIGYELAAQVLHSVSYSSMQQRNHFFSLIKLKLRSAKNRRADLSMNVLIGQWDIAAAEPDAQLILLHLDARVTEDLTVP